MIDILANKEKQSIFLISRQPLDIWRVVNNTKTPTSFEGGVFANLPQSNLSAD